jgi:FG-GAP repeat
MRLNAFAPVAHRHVERRLINLSPLEAGAGCGGEDRQSTGLAAGSRGVAVEIQPLVRWSVATIVLLPVVLVAALLMPSTQPPAISHAARHAGAQHVGLASLPLAAQGVVSGALGADNGAYRVSAAHGGLRAVNPGQELRAGFDRQGVLVQSGATRLRLHLGAIGYGASLAAIAPVMPRAEGNRVVYTRRGLSEWYSNGPLGLEQGFTLARTPVGDASGPLTLSLALSGNVHASVDERGRGLTLAAPGASSLRYDNLLATDAGGRALYSWITLQASRVLLHVDARGARYPLRIDPLIQQGKKLTGGTEETGKGAFGFSVALSSDGNTALIGGAFDNKFLGAAWVFTRSEGLWTQQGGILLGKEESGEAEFGTIVALSSDGNTALIGGPGDNKLLGAAWVFTRSEGLWTQQGAKITGKEESGEGRFGYGGALSSEGNTALIGGPTDNKTLGAAWVFTLSGGKWTQQGAKITGKEEMGEGKFGWKTALSSDGNTALIGGYSDNKTLGAAWVFTLSGGKWTQQAKLTGGTEETGEGGFGYSVALSSEGNTALIGAPDDDNFTGAAWVFTLSGGKWTQQGAKITGGTEQTGAEGQFGYGVALTADGNTALIGAPGDNKNLGAAWLFARTDGKWAHQGAKITGKEETGEGKFGFRVALSSEGATTLIGGYNDNTSVGAAWVFTPSELTQQGAKLTGKEETGKGEFGSFSVALSSDGNTALIGGRKDNEGLGAAWVFTRSEGLWTQQGAKLTGKEETGKGEFGYSVALSSDGNTALIGGWKDNEGLGAAWVFTRSEGLWTQQGPKITGKEGAGNEVFGSGVALSSDGNTAPIGGEFDGNATGAAWVFTLSGGKWTQQGAKITGKEEVGLGEFGSGVALSSDGNTALIGGGKDNKAVGAAWVFTLSGGKWTQQGAKITAKEEVGEALFGESVALASNGNEALIGGLLDNGSVGAVWVFTRSGGKWTQQGAKITGKEEVGGGAFGSAGALSSEGGTALIGGEGDNEDIGAAWVFVAK